MSWKPHETGNWLRLYKISAVLSALDFSRGLFLVYFASLGFTNSQLGILQSTLFWASFLLDLPTGVFADRKGRKLSVLIGLSLFGIAYLTLSIAGHFSLALVGFALLGAAYAFNSGASGALVYDGMKESGWLDRHIHLLGQARSLAMLGTCASILVGGLIFQWSPPAIFWLTGAAAVVSLAFFAQIPEPQLNADARATSVTGEVRGFIRRSEGKSFLIFLFGMGFIEMVHTPVFIFSQLFFHELGLNAMELSFLLAGGFLASSIAQNFAPKLRGLSILQLIVATSVILAISLVGIAVVNHLWLQIVFYFVINTLPSVLFVHSDQYIQDRVDSGIRASLLSLHSLVSTLMISLSYISMGFLSEKIGMAQTFALSSIMLIFAIATVCIHFRREGQYAF